jgi:hypothetical protein
MRKRYAVCVVHVKDPNRLSYLIAEHSGLDPIDFLKKVIEAFAFGILFLGHDAPTFLSASETERMVEGMHREGIEAVTNAGFIWVNHNELPKLYQKKSCNLFGDAVLLTAQPVGEDFSCTSLPEPSGFNKNKISSRDTIVLDQMLSGDDIYVYDDFRETFIVTKNSEILDIIHDEIKNFSS